MTQAEVRQMFVRYYPGVRRFGLKGYWYRCAHCGNWCGRPGREHANIPDYMKMEVDHIRPWSQGGSDEIWNLQPLCRPCNRKKSSDITLRDSIKIAKNNVLHGDFVKAGINKSVRNNVVLKGLGITSRK